MKKLTYEELELFIVKSSMMFSEKWQDTAKALKHLESLENSNSKLPLKDIKETVNIFYCANVTINFSVLKKHYPEKFGSIYQDFQDRVKDENSDEMFEYIDKYLLILENESLFDFAIMFFIDITEPSYFLQENTKIDLIIQTLMIGFQMASDGAENIFKEYEIVQI